MIVLIHTSKTMRPAPEVSTGGSTTPLFLDEAAQINTALRASSLEIIQQTMHVSEKLAEAIYENITAWTADPSNQRAAIDSFLGDIYSGLQVQTWSQGDREYAQNNMRILSGLYGILRPLDGIAPYRFEMGYKVPGSVPQSAYDFWGARIAETLPNDELIVNLTAIEYGKVVTKYLESERIITPRFLTVSPKTGQPVFVVVHAKIARGAFAGWMVRERSTSREQLSDFTELGYEYSEADSTQLEPVYVCREFKGLGMSVRLS